MPARDAWAGEVVAACGFQAAELALRLTADALDDRRPAAFAGERTCRYLAHLVDGVETVCRLLQKLPAPPAARRRVPSARRAVPPSPGFAVLRRLNPAELDAISGRLILATAGLGFEVGIEQQVHEARRAGGLPDLAIGARTGEPSDRRPIMDYHAVVSPALVYGLRESSPCGPEDHLFATAHQITECWLNVVHCYIAEARLLAEGRRWLAAADAMANACDVLPLAIAAGQLLDQLVLADYHPLRVRLRDGSGAQSVAARRLGPAVRAAAGVLWAELDFDNVSVLDLLRGPDEDLERYRYLTMLKRVSKQVQSFLFQHYLLALGVLGTHTVGSLGYEIREMADRAVQPMFPEINQAHHDYVMLTNFEHGASSGSIVRRNEVAAGWDPYIVVDRPSRCPDSVVRARVAEYFRAIQDRDAEAWVALFEPLQGQLQDGGSGSRPFLGKDRLRVFINGMFRAFREMKPDCSPVHVDGNNASVDWKFAAVSYHGIETKLEGREEFLFDDQGRIVKASAHWQPAMVAQQWLGRPAGEVRSRDGRPSGPGRVGVSAERESSGAEPSPIRSVATRAQ